MRYWSEPDLGYLTHYDSITISAQLQSALSLMEAEALSFGSVAAYADDPSTATMILSPAGGISVTSAGSARITPLGGTQVGVFNLSGAAPSYGVSITPEAGSIFLTHITEGTGSARFVVKDFVTSPADPDGRTDASGDLEILLGATLETEVTNKAFADGVYNGTYNLTVSY